MGDLIVGCCIVTAVAAGVFLGFQRLLQPFNPAYGGRLAVLVVAGLFCYVYEFWYDIRVAHLLPTSNLIVLGNWLPIFAALLAAIAWKSSPIGFFRRSLCLTGLAVAAGYALVYPLLGTAPQCGDQWDHEGHCRQTTPRTCSPAAAATLLARHGIPATEQEMAELCLTRQGTSWQGLYRGLQLKTAGAAWTVQVVQGQTADLRKLSGPMILSVGLLGNESRETALTREFGWIPGVNHSVVLLGFNEDGSAEIADPSLTACREKWSPEMLQTLWRGHAFRLVPRR